MEDEILNIEYHTRRLILKALNATDSKADAAYALGVSERTIHRYIRLYNIKKERKTGVYYYEDKAIKVTEYTIIPKLIT